MKIHFFNPAVHVICMTLHTDVCVCVNVSPDGAKSIYHLAIRVSHDNIKEVNLLLYIYITATSLLLEDFAPKCGTWMKGTDPGQRW